MYAHETGIFFTLLIAAAVLALVLSFFVVTMVKHQQKKTETANEKLLAEIRLLETERERIAADLHDELGPLISAIKIHLQCLHTTEKEDTAIIGKTGEYIDATMHKIRAIANNLVPASIREKGLPGAVQDLKEMIGTGQPISVLYECKLTGLAMAAEQQLSVFRIIQEIVNNAVKHSGASLLIIRLSEKKHSLLVHIEDNGIGFNAVRSAGKQTGSGLRNIVRRVEMLEGRVYLNSKPGEGTRYTIHLPLRSYG